MEFVEGWSIAQILGEGAYGEVKLLINQQNGIAVALKVIDILKHADAREMVRKEVGIHRRMHHPNILRFYGDRFENNKSYIFLEYASGGELFDRIDPDNGMPAWKAQKYFNQLMDGVDYMHSHGIAHRDIKPENLLLNEDDNLKIADFGFATLFRMNGIERTLSKRCGTMTYTAPEVHLKPPYHAQPADIWSCGIVLVALLCGEIPWDSATADCPQYLQWKDRLYMEVSPWNKLDNMALSLLRRMLAPVPSDRSTMRQIEVHRWTNNTFRKEIGSSRGQESSPLSSPNAKRLRTGSSVSTVSLADDGLTRLCQSQPEHQRDEPACRPLTSDERIAFSFSQPAHLEDLIVSSQVEASPGSQNTFQKLVRRMTRFFVGNSCEEAILALGAMLEKQGYTVKRNPTHMLTISTLDKRKMQLVFKATVLDMNGNTLLDFRLSSGCGLEFKKRFVRIKESLGDMVLPGLVTWPVAIATNSIP